MATQRARRAGVEQHIAFFKSVEDARELRRKVLQCFERAALPETSDVVGSPLQLPS